MGNKKKLKKQEAEKKKVEMKKVIRKGKCLR